MVGGARAVVNDRTGERAVWESPPDHDRYLHAHPVLPHLARTSPPASPRRCEPGAPDRPVGGVTGRSCQGSASSPRDTGSPSESDGDGGAGQGAEGRGALDVPGDDASRLRKVRPPLPTYLHGVQGVGTIDVALPPGESQNRRRPSTSGARPGNGIANNRGFSTSIGIGMGKRDIGATLARLVGGVERGQRRQQQGGEKCAGNDAHGCVFVVIERRVSGSLT